MCPCIGLLSHWLVMKFNTLLKNVVARIALCCSWHATLQRHLLVAKEDAPPLWHLEGSIPRVGVALMAVKTAPPARRTTAPDCAASICGRVAPPSNGDAVRSLAPPSRGVRFGRLGFMEETRTHHYDRSMTIGVQSPYVARTRRQSQ